MRRYFDYLFSPRFEEKRFAYGCLTPAVFVILLFQVTPLLYSLYASTSRYSLIGRSRFIGLRNFIKFFNEGPAILVLKNTLIYMSVSVSLSFVIGFAVALLLNRKFRGERVFRTLILLPLMISPVVSGFIWAFIFNDQYGLINQALRSFNFHGYNWLSDPRITLWIIIFVGIWMYIPWFTIVLYAGLQALPITFFEAADMDGANRWQKLRFITIPLLLPVIMVAVVIQTLNGLMVFDTVFVITFGGPGLSSEVLSIHAYKEAFYFFHLGYGTSIAVITAIIALFIGILIFRFLSKRIERMGF